MSYTVNKCEIENTLRDLVACYIEQAIPYISHVEFHGVLGIKLDNVQEFFVCLNKTINKPGSVASIPRQGKGLAVKNEADNGEYFQETAKVVLTGDSYQTLMKLLQDDHVTETAQSTQVAVAVHNYAQPQMVLEHVESDIEITNTSSEVLDEGTAPPGGSEVDQSNITIEEDNNVEHLEMFTSLKADVAIDDSSTELVSKSKLDVIPNVDLNNKAKTSVIYKPPKGHLNKPLCECCEVLNRYRQKDRDVAARRRAAVSGRPAPPYNASKSKIIYKLPYGHINSCMCCAVLAARRNSMNEMTRNKRERQYALRDAKRKKVYPKVSSPPASSNVKIKPETSVVQSVVNSSNPVVAEAIGMSTTCNQTIYTNSLVSTTDSLHKITALSKFEMTEECDVMDVAMNKASNVCPTEHVNNAPCQCCEVLFRFNKNLSRAKQRKIARRLGEPLLPMQETRAPYYKLSPDHIDVCSCCVKLADLRNRPSKK